jgi:hypothetical protein
MNRESMPVFVLLRRLLWVGPVTVLSSIVAVLVVRLITVLALHPDPKFLPLTMLPVVLDTTVLVTWAVLVFGVVMRFAADPIQRYRRIAGRVLLVSFLPDIALAKSHTWGAIWPYVLALMVMHVAAWAVCVTALPKFMRAKHAD